MADDWTAPAVIVSTIGVVVTGSVGWVTWLNYRYLRGGERAVVRADFHPSRGSHNYLALRLQVENHTSSTWTSIGFEVRKPRGLRAANLQGTPTRRSDSRAQFADYDEAFEALATSASVQLGGDVAPAGDEGRMLFERRVGPTDKENRWVYLERAPLKPGSRLSMRVTLRSNDAKPRKLVIPIKRVVSAEMLSETS